ncbi:hypothetical protein LJC68_01840 [Bacteroidales bacterium OttesenSCG-928-B11]|nr:hypothetical protein [Bacteroidales bacterium OttesenSCG-928-C03]MDL2311603.1 hypothetical protein [Bacteroidales bacterium OttesenSCG-928-B11]MDL2326230.1 hypothetical protein [Bacteroidales bacterium OttesenSCG-928-A14]
MKRIFNLSVLSFTISFFILTTLIFCNKRFATNVHVVYDGVVKFENYKKYKNTYNQLKNKHDHWNQQLSAHFINLPLGMVDSVLASKGFNSEKILDDFERDNGFKSLRSKINEELLSYYRTGNNSPDPEIHIVLDDVERSLLNQWGEIMIGDTIYHYKNCGAIVKTVLFEELKTIRELSAAECQSTGFAGDYHDIRKNSDCCSFYCKDYDYGDKRIKWYVSFYNVSNLKSVANVKAVVEKRNENNQWQRHFDKLNVNLEGILRNAGFDGQHTKISSQYENYWGSTLSGQVEFDENLVAFRGDLMANFTINKHCKFCRVVR